MNIDDVRALDVREIVARDLGPGRHGGAYKMYKCPFHDDSKPSLSVTAKGYRCHACGASGDGIGWMMQYHKLTFNEAVKALGGDEKMPSRPNRPERTAQPVEDALKPPPKDWQNRGMEVIARAERMLESDAGARARAYLSGRGLSEYEIARSRLGYVPGKPSQWAKIAGLNVPCGILIPWVIEGELWQLKVRRAAGDIKYQQVAGGSAGGLYGIDRVRGDRAVMIVEGEFDAMIVRQTAQVDAVALGTASNTLRVRWINKLLLAPAVYARMDADRAGKAALERLRAISRRIAEVTVPQPYKDCNEFAIDDPLLFAWWLEELMDRARV